MATKRWRLLWSENTHTLTDVVKDLGIPVLVKVDESTYEINDERFKRGDLLQIHSKKTVTKVVGSVMDDDESRTPPQSRKKINRIDNISISVGNKRGLTIKRRDAGLKVYQSVRQLVKERPKYVRLINDTTDKRGYTIKAKSDFEIIGTEKGGGLSGLCDGYNYTLCLDQPLRCLLLSDSTVYTIQEVIDRYPLPQIVSFSTAESPNLGVNPYTGMKDISLDGKCVEIKSVIQQEVFIGTLNPSTKSPSTSAKDKYISTMVVIPVDSVTASQLQVKIPQQPEDDNYGVVMSKTLPKTDDAFAAIEETIDTVNYPNVLFVPRKEIPKLPQRHMKRTPPTAQGRAQTKPTKKEQTNYDDDDGDDYEPVGPQVLPSANGAKTQKPKPPIPTKKPSKNPLPSKDEVNEPALYDRGPTAVEYEDEEEHPYDVISDLGCKEITRGKRIKSDSESIESLLSKVPTKVRDGLLKVQAELLNLKGKVIRRDSIMKPSDRKKPDKPRSLSCSSDFETKPHVKATVPGAETANDTKPTKEGNMSKNVLSKLRGIVPKNRKMSSKEKFAALNNAELIACLQRCGLNNMVDEVKKENLDGKFFYDVDDETMRSTFGLGNIQLMKFNKLRDFGWEPKTD
ncbi:uncharacterized protein LOC117326016 [Pecten maximus]|uniref:uncharacterized protein LOC117326016 n=1 Tax=Pecten maximus TaxID=6579 RepID=UPI001458C92A|nr:uncharacterized protein LOC117326016 [Pecten maximus]